ncbi:DUF2550 domain-containing protein [Nocardiopsis chromatogenes]|uniref:DUF2550 domain-containing protein n=1 Tax=Nocardiopsis chromatogenes TaxID=280239 RepID=UPI00034C639F
MGERLTGVNIAEWSFLVLLAAALAGVAALAVRRYALERRGGAVECYLRPYGGGPWRIGLGRYGSSALHWYRVLSLWPRPAATLPRRGLVVVGRRAPDTGDLAELTGDMTVVQLGWTGPDGADPDTPGYELAMGTGALTGFLSWLESMPPGPHWEG